eukprot:1429273-Pyramimonas_sp.AAC.1
MLESTLGQPCSRLSARYIRKKGECSKYSTLNGVMLSTVDNQCYDVHTRTNEPRFLRVFLGSRCIRVYYWCDTLGKYLVVVAGRAESDGAHIHTVPP